MKRIGFYLLLIMSISFNTYCQINPQDIFTADTCVFDTLNIALEIDTKQAGNIWQIGNPSKSIIDTAYVSTRAIITDSVNSYPEDNISSFTIKLPHYKRPWHTLSFWHRYETDANADGGYVEWSIDGGEYWLNVVANVGIGDISRNFDEFYTKDDTIAGNEPGFSGSSNGWIESWIHWSPADLLTTMNRSAGLSSEEKSSSSFPDTTWVRFTFVSDASPSEKDGWCIDNIIHTVADIPLNIDPTEFETESKVYPNPCMETLYIKNPHEYSKLTIVNEIGEIIHIDEGSPESIATGFLDPGIYFLQLYDSSELLKTIKFVKIN